MIPDWLDHHLEPYQHIVRDGRSFRDLVSDRIPAELLAGCRRLALLILRPDCLIAGTAASLLESLESDHDIIPLRLRVTWLTPWHFDAIYRRKLPLFGANTWLHHEVFRKAPSAIVLAGGLPGALESLCQRLDRLKGPSSPVDDSEPGQLRSQSPRLSSFHPVVHCSEDPGSLLYESSLIFPWTDICRALGLVSEHDLPPDLPLGLEREGRRQLLSFPAATTETVFATAWRVKRKILAALAMDGNPSDRVRIVELSAIMETHRVDLHASYRSQRSAMVELGRAEREPLRALIAAFERAGPPTAAPPGTGRTPSYLERWQTSGHALRRLHLLYASWFLAGHEPYTLDDGQTLLRLLDSADVPLLPWEETLIRSGLLCDLNPDSRWGGQSLFPGDEPGTS